MPHDEVRVLFSVKLHNFQHEFLSSVCSQLNAHKHSTFSFWAPLINYQIILAHYSKANYQSSESMQWKREVLKIKRFHIDRSLPQLWLYTRSICEWLLMMGKKFITIFAYYFTLNLALTYFQKVFCRLNYSAAQQ